jgi:arginase
MKEIEIIEFPSNLGLYEPAPGKEPGVKRLPEWLKKFGFYEIIKPTAIHFLQPLPYSMNTDKASAVRNADAIAAYAKQQVPIIVKSVSKNKFPLVIGGDCSILIGNMLALKQRGNFCLFFLDGHTDYLWPELSQTGGAAGMDLAIVTGHGHDKLTNIDLQKPYVKEETVWCMGNREYDDPEYIAAIENSGINYYDLNRLRKEGIEKCVADFLAVADNKKSDGFWIHLDADVLDDDIMPAVDSRSPGGLSYDELRMILRKLLESPKAAGMEITIIDPDLDPDGKYTKAFARQVGNVFREANSKK